MTREEALLLMGELVSDCRWDQPEFVIEALRILSRPCIELDEGERVVADDDWVDILSGVITRTVVTRRKA
jgi:hypothetical protein